MFIRIRCNYTLGHLSRNSRLSTGSVRKRREQCAARFWRKTWVPLLLGGFLAACDTGGAGGVQMSDPGRAGGLQMTKTKWHASTFAGRTDGTIGQDGIGTQASFSHPFGIVKKDDTLYVTDFNQHSIRTIDIATRDVQTLVTRRSAGSFREGTFTEARFNKPRGIAVGVDGKLYVADYGNHRIRSINLTTKIVETVAGGKTGTVTNPDAIGENAQFNGPSGLAVNGAMLYVADTHNNLIRSVNTQTKQVKTIAGGGSVTDTALNVKGEDAKFNGPSDVAVIGDKLYVADYGNNLIRSIDLTSDDKTVSTIVSAETTEEGGLAVIGKTLYFTSKADKNIWAWDTTEKTLSQIATIDFNPLYMTEGSDDTLYVTTVQKFILKLQSR